MEASTLLRLGVMALLSGAAIAVAFGLQRRRPDPPSAPSYRAPAQLDRNDFTQPEKPILVVSFTSTGCSTCPQVWRDLEPMASDRVAVERVDVEADPDLHRRYRIDGVPTTVFSGHDGAVQHAFFGPVGTEELRGALETTD